MQISTFPHSFLFPAVEIPEILAMLVLVVVVIDFLSFSYTTLSLGFCYLGD